MNEADVLDEARRWADKVRQAVQPAAKGF
jgi:hypothetical protein